MRSDGVLGSDKVFLRALCEGEGEVVVNKGEVFVRKEEGGRWMAGGWEGVCS